jgi:hypothetical protein
MKQFWLGSVALAFLGAGLPALATDMPIVPVKAPVYKAAAPFSWEGHTSAFMAVMDGEARILSTRPSPEHRRQNSTPPGASAESRSATIQ